MEQRILRTLYRTDDTEQLFLARSRSLVPIYRLTTISDDTESASNGQPTEYASVSVKDCIESLCEASPDLFKDQIRDFSVYHLDPLESVGSAGGSTSSHTLAGVPVGLGLMSDLKLADRNLLLTGTLTKLRTGLEALEVVFTIREIRRPNSVNLKSRPCSSSSQPGPSTHHDNPNIAAALTRRKNEQEAKGRRTMRGSNDKRHLNRQLGSAAARCGVAESLLAGAGNYHTAGKKSSSEEPPAYSSTPPETAVYPSPPASQPQASSSSQPTPEPFTQPSSSSTVPDTATLLAVLGLIDDASATTNLEGNTQFQEALKGLLAQVLNTAPPAKPPDEDDDVVPLDKENVNPDAFRKRARSLEATKSPESAAPSPQLAPTPDASDHPNQGLGLGGRSNTLPLVKEKHRAVSSSSENRSGGSRKGKERAKDTIYSSFSGSGSTVPWSSPPRPLNGGYNYGGTGSSRGTPIVIPDSPLTPKAVRIPASSPIRGNKSKQKQKPYVVPEWARTTTATQPKFSEEFQRTQEEDQKRQVEARKTRRAQWPSMKSRSTTSLPTTTKTTSIPDTESTTDERPCTPPPLPVFAAAGLSSQPIFALPVCAASSSAFLYPKTPPRKRPRSPSQSPLNRSGGLFTPTPKHSSFAEAFHSPLYSPSHRARKMIRSDPGPLDTAIDPHDTEDDDALTRELGSALDELVTSSTSLPVVSNDAETESSANDDVDVSSDNEGDGEDTYPRKQFWPGLPPSSPPPSSPMLQDHFALPPVDTPIEESDNDSRLPVVSSDVEDMLSPSDDRTPMNSDTPDTGLDNFEGQGTELPPATSAAESDANLFALFTNLGNTSSDPLEYDWNLPGDMATTTNLEDLDFTQFWESVKPLIDDQQQPTCSSGDVQMNNGAPTVDPNEGTGFLQLEGSAGTALDSGKFADDLRTLYSGCVM
ncbi:hypothetical protein AAF712_000492 [Marasmius tenuissimus]|uniref:Uncharacterized protein n=1 Tax=Marasmius tenuissimus TaxID=585030 RepID=A0ABR3AIF7_9AGAR